MTVDLPIADLLGSGRQRRFWPTQRPSVQMFSRRLEGHKAVEQDLERQQPPHNCIWHFFILNEIM